MLRRLDSPAIISASGRLALTLLVALLLPLDQAWCIDVNSADAIVAPLDLDTAPPGDRASDTWDADDSRLLAYVSRVLDSSDRALAYREDMELAGHRVAQERERFRTVVRPIANLAVDSTARPRTGLEFSRKTRWGIDLNAGYATDGFGSGASTRSFARLGIPLLQGSGRQDNELPLTRAELFQRRQMLDTDRRLQMLIAQAVERHVALVLASHLERRAEQALGRAARHVDAARARQRVGLVSKVDVHRAELNRLERIEAEEQARFNLELEREAFAELAQIEPERVRTARKLPTLAVRFSDSFRTEQRAEWHAQQIDERLTRLELAAAKRRLRPDIKFEVAWFGIDQPGAFDSGFGDQQAVHYALRMNSDLNFGAERRAIRAWEIELRRAMRSGEQLERQLQREVRQAAARVESLGRRKALAALRREESERAVQLAQLRFERGIASNLDAIDAEAILADVELGELRAAADYVAALAGLALARGELSLPWLQNALGGDL